jgi:hypothetical protein
LQKGNKQTFTGRYHCFNLVYYEQHRYISDAIAREKAIKNWPRAWKENLITKENPEWLFLNHTLFDCWPPVDCVSRVPSLSSPAGLHCHRPRAPFIVITRAPLHCHPPACPGDLTCTDRDPGTSPG